MQRRKVNKTPFRIRAFPCFPRTQSPVFRVPNPRPHDSGVYLNAAEVHDVTVSFRSSAAFTAY